MIIGAPGLLESEFGLSLPNTMNAANRMPKARINIHDCLSHIAPSAWDALVHTSGGNPTLRHAFLQSMIDAGNTTAETGWLPQFITLTREVDGAEKLVGAIPLYMKGHSYGEYVFDWAWAEAYQRAGLDYYPKLLCAVPFTPCTGSRILAANDDDRALLLDALLEVASNSDVSSLHVLFTNDTEHKMLCKKGLMARQAVQFHWQNHGYASFDDFLSRMNHDKRKKIKQERKNVANAGVSLIRKVGVDISESDWDFFTTCYENTYREHHSTPYLNRKFFSLIAACMPENILMVIASQDGKPIATSLNLFDNKTLFGRYWGSTRFVSGLHFETCYYQTLEFCIAQKIASFEGGAQGEHKQARGFSPVTCHSAHWVKDTRFTNAIDDFLRRESSGIARYVDELNDHEPFKQAEKSG